MFISESLLRQSMLLKSHSEVTFDLFFKDLFVVIDLSLFSNHNSVINELSAHFVSFRVVFFFVSHDTEHFWHTFGRFHETLLSYPSFGLSFEVVDLF